MRIADIARLVGGTLAGEPETVLTGVNSLELAGPADVSYVSSPAHVEQGRRSRAGALIAPPGFTSSSAAVITVKNPKLAFVKLVWIFHPAQPPGTDIHPTAVVDPSAQIGDHVRIGPGVVIGAGVRIGADTLIYPNVTVYHDVTIGARVIIHAGTVIGSDGFGFVLDGDYYLKVPQLGTVVIEDDVELGANCTIDRATFGSTVIQRGTKFDNLIHVAHNVTVGAHTISSAQVGIAGSSKIGSYVTLAGQSGVADNAVVGDHAILGAQTAVITRQIIPAHQVVWGTPARPMDETKERIASLALLPKLRRRVLDLEARLKALEEVSGHGKPS